MSPAQDRVPAGATDQTGGRVVLAQAEISRALRRIAHEILEGNKGTEGLVLMGIATRGVPLAQRLARALHDVEGVEIPVGTLDITMYRDDLRSQPVRAMERSEVPDGGVDARVVVLVDDVLYSGRTVRAALDSLADLGRPQAVRLAVLVDRGHRELPIRADYVGKNLPTAQSERVSVRLQESDGVDEVVISAPESGTLEGARR
ncbi:bifunctional pyr operon transcriptional regulator/uracil phosphoribosyltransferase PyrR [Ornithinimicrobium sp. F0845]|uniref:bifunctional pyr operon transcriptional regulator/uracil phosphoribosyltransferase PyrR n=1 Tax=Ornithinimicrobium sp. F0845 TaxID=2926412 RepID=UPI001FF4E41B|nr:bifunctional pyr operon transcriptional regulator/uracil phosphoribosyltransferase PyrR [Ornithinimicrobium sp. F0845]MCK0114249.1 bifunctional pyr operon transcriptional regulator/uracil phosphoribosyltransferase PyrR [Ornithinimicrobium sp. F0845]